MDSRWKDPTKKPERGWAKYWWWLKRGHVDPKHQIEKDLAKFRRDKQSRWSRADCPPLGELVRTDAHPVVLYQATEAELRAERLQAMLLREHNGREPWVERQARLRPDYAETFENFPDKPTFGEPNPSLGIRSKRRLASLATAVCNPVETLCRCGRAIPRFFCPCCFEVQTPRIFCHRTSSDDGRQRSGKGRQRPTSDPHATTSGSIQRSKETYAHLKQAHEQTTRSKHLLKPPKPTYGRDCEDPDEALDDSEPHSRNQSTTDKEAQDTDTDGTALQQSTTSIRNTENSAPDTTARKYIDSMIVQDEDRALKLRTLSVARDEDDSSSGTATEIDVSDREVEKVPSIAPKISLDHDRFLHSFEGSLRNWL